MKKRSRLETLLFESSILDIDFSQLNQYLTIKILASWDKFDEDTFLIHEVKEIKLEKIHAFRLTCENKDFEMAENAAAGRGIRVTDTSFSKNRSDTGRPNRAKGSLKTETGFSGCLFGFRGAAFRLQRLQTPDAA